MKIIITESQYKTLLESSDNSNVVEKIMNHMGIKYDGHEFLERSYDNFGRTHDTVIFYFRLPDDDYSYYRRIHFLTRNNKVIRVDSAGDFRTIDDAFRYIPTDVLMDYFIEKGKTYLEKFLPKRYPNDNLKESVIKESQSDDLIKSILKQNNIVEVVFGYINRSYDNHGKQYDSVYVFFNFSNLEQKEIRVHFETRGYKVIGVDSYGNFFNIIDEFNYLPKDVVIDYFVSKAKTYVEKILPFEH